MSGETLRLRPSALSPQAKLTHACDSLSGLARKSAHVITVRKRLLTRESRGEFGIGAGDCVSSSASVWRELAQTRTPRAMRQCGRNGSVGPTLGFGHSSGKLGRFLRSVLQNLASSIHSSGLSVT